MGKDIDDLIDKLSGTHIDFESDGPEFLDFALLDYYEGADGTFMIVAVNEDGVNNNFSNDLDIYYLEKDIDGFHSFESKHIEDVYISFAQFELSDNQLDAVRLSVDFDEDLEFGNMKNPVYFSWLNISKNDEYLQLLNEPLRFSQFPIEKVNSALFNSLGDDEYLRYKTLQVKSNDDPKNKSLRVNFELAENAFAKTYWDFLTELFSAQADAKEFLPIKELSLANLYPENFSSLKSLQDLFNLSAEDILKRVKYKSAINYIFGSYSDFDSLEKLAQEEINKRYGDFDFSDADIFETEAFTKYRVGLAIDNGWKNGKVFWHVLVPVAAISYLLMAVISSGSLDPRYSLLPGLFYLADLDTRIVSAYSTEKRFNPGILGFAKSAIKYCFNFLNGFRATGSYLTKYKSDD